MKRTYKAVLRGNQLDWSSEPPDHAGDHPVPVEVTLLGEAFAETGHTTEDSSRGQRMAAILEELAHTSPISAIEDPSSWQREVRRERPLPDRAE